MRSLDGVQFDGVSPGLGPATLACHCLLLEGPDGLVLVDTGVVGQNGEIGDSSIVVKIETWAREWGGKHAEKVTEGVFTYVALDEDGHPRKL